MHFDTGHLIQTEIVFRDHAEEPADPLAIGGDSGEVTLPHYPEYSNRALNVVKTGRTEVYFRLVARLGKCNRTVF